MSDRDVEVVDRVARVLAAMDGKLSSYKTHPFYRNEMQKKAELLLDFMESWDLTVVLQ